MYVVTVVTQCIEGFPHLPTSPPHEIPPPATKYSASVRCGCRPVLPIRPLVPGHAQNVVRDANNQDHAHVLRVRRLRSACSQAAHHRHYGQLRRRKTVHASSWSHDPHVQRDFQSRTRRILGESPCTKCGGPGCSDSGRLNDTLEHSNIIIVPLVANRDQKKARWGPTVHKKSQKGGDVVFA